MSEEKLETTIIKWALKNFGNLSNKLELPVLIKPNLRKSGIQMTSEEYSSLVLAASIVLPAVLAFLSTMVLIILGTSLIMLVPYFVLIFAVFAGLIFGAGYMYPGMRTSDIKKNIMNNLPFSTIYLTTLSGSGMNSFQMFKILSHFEEFGEVSKEAKRIVRDVDVLGNDMATALEKAAERTPSTQLREMLWGMRSTVTTGGDMNNFLMEKSRSYMGDYRRFLDKFVDQLSILMEVYITAVVVGSIFFIIMGTILGLMGGGQPLVLVRMLIYIGIPIMSVMFMILIAGMSPE
jgi:archaeal flagellar protein FlaJ